MDMPIKKPDVGILDIAHVLQKKILYLTGGKDKEGHPLIICDEFATGGGSVNPYTDDEFHNTALYLKYTAKILWNDSKFVIILNRLATKWACVMTILKSLDVFSEDEIEHILLLKPQGFIQKHFGKNDIKQVQNSSKHKIIIVDNAVKLEEYIEKVDLPSQFGGCDYFNVNEWVEYAMAVERFQVTCKKVECRVINMKDLFSKSSSLASSEEVDKCSKQYLQLVEDIKNEIDCTIEIAETLAPIVDKSLGFSHKKPSPLEEYNSTQLKMYSDILGKLGEDVDIHWQDQKKLLNETQEICNFEESYGKVSMELMEIISILKSQNDIGNSLKDVSELIEELNFFEEKKKKPYEKSVELTKNTLNMVKEFSFYPVDNVTHQLDELKKLCDSFETALSNRREILQISFDVYKCLDQLDNWCKSAIDLLVSQPVESLTTNEGAMNCLTELDTFMKNKQGINMKNMNKIDTLTKKLENVTLINKVSDALLRMDEVKVMLEKRETSLKKVGDRTLSPVQPVRALNVNDVFETVDDGKEAPSVDTDDMLVPTLRRVVDSVSSSHQKSKKPPVTKMAKKDIKLIPIETDEKRKRNRLRKSMKLALKRPVSSTYQDILDFEEDPEFERKIMLVVNELIDTEYIYVKDLRCVIDGYVTAFDDANYDVPEIMSIRKGIIFGNIKDIFEFHNSVFLEELRSCKNKPYLVGHVFLNQKEKFNLYADYCKNKAKSEVVRKELASTSSFLDLRQKELGHKLNLDSYLLKPVQRITKYQLLLTEMLKYVSKKNPAYNNIMQALHTMKKSLRHVNDVMHSTGLIGFPSDLNIDDQGKLILQDSFIVREGKKNALKQLTKLGAKHRQVFLFEACIIISKKEVENNRDIGTYLFKECIMTSQIGVTEIVKGEQFTFEIWINQRDEVFFLQAENLEVKNSWLVEIRRILMTQFQGVKKNVTPNSPLSAILEKPKFVDLNIASPKAGRNSGSYEDITWRPIISSTFSQSESSLLRSSSDFEELEEFYDDDSGWSESEFGGIEEEQVEEEIDNKLNKISINVNTFKAIADYDGLEESELSLSAGDLVNLLKEGDEGWWFCRNVSSQREGWVPSSYLASPAITVPKVFTKSKIETSV